VRFSEQVGVVRLPPEARGAHGGVQLVQNLTRLHHGIVAPVDTAVIRNYRLVERVQLVLFSFNFVL